MDNMKYDTPAIFCITEKNSAFSLTSKVQMSLIKYEISKLTFNIFPSLNPISSLISKISTVYL